MGLHGEALKNLLEFACFREVRSLCCIMGDSVPLDVSVIGSKGEEGGSFHPSL